MCLNSHSGVGEGPFLPTLSLGDPLTLARRVLFKTQPEWPSSFSCMGRLSRKAAWPWRNASEIWELPLQIHSSEPPPFCPNLVLLKYPWECLHFSLCNFHPTGDGSFSVHPPCWSVSSMRPALFHNIKVQSGAWSLMHSQYLWMENRSCTSACPKLRALGWIILLCLSVFKNGKSVSYIRLNKKASYRTLCALWYLFCKMEEEVGRDKQRWRDLQRRGDPECY